jgi:aminopeptidase
MDLRIPRWAKTLIGYCLEVQPGQVVVVDGSAAAEPLLAEVHREILRAGGHPVTRVSLASLREIELREGSDDQLTWISPADRTLFEQMDASLRISSEVNTRQLATIDPKRMALTNRAARALADLRRHGPGGADRRWCLTLFPTEAYAQEAGMALAEFEEFVYEACFLNSEDPAARWCELGERQQFYVDWLADKRSVHVIGPETDLHLSIEGRVFRNSDGKRNFPSGEFFTGPVEESVEGTIFFSVPSVVNGQAVRNIRLTFEQGRVVEATAEQGQQYLDEMLETDLGARFVGEFAFGNNPGIQRGIQRILFDEKIGGTIHMALGNSYPETGGKNSSALHWDMICDLRAPAGGGEVWVDGTLFLKDGGLVVQP